jgi:hypothetical protein
MVAGPGDSSVLRAGGGERTGTLPHSQVQVTDIATPRTNLQHYILIIDSAGLLPIPSFSTVLNIP